MISSGFNLSGILIAILAYAVPAAIVLFAAYWVIRSAVGSALKRHQYWLDTRSAPGGGVGIPPEIDT
ncbi:hypothetical protein NVV95_17910 [Herbiconiux sp. CPCC 205716]|uniref:Uncharacterized protein n=1 Tax=Herbiconiux gentiana TaxID=2970912 RepID=A0ABT2GJM8_9MICO|nr:hypothetical protein [Herbiconiux gentiana]MCS5716426.1 hypothetical protein [Herbiconiux gentiana]